MLTLKAHLLQLLHLVGVIWRVELRNRLHLSFVVSATDHHEATLFTDPEASLILQLIVCNLFNFSGHIPILLTVDLENGCLEPCGLTSIHNKVLRRVQALYLAVEFEAIEFLLQISLRTGILIAFNGLPHEAGPSHRDVEGCRVERFVLSPAHRARCATLDSHMHR